MHIFDYLQTSAAIILLSALLIGSYRLKYRLKGYTKKTPLP